MEASATAAEQQLAALELRVGKKRRLAKQAATQAVARVRAATERLGSLLRRGGKYTHTGRGVGGSCPL